MPAGLVGDRFDACLRNGDALDCIGDEVADEKIAFAVRVARNEIALRGPVGNLGAVGRPGEPKLRQRLTADLLQRVAGRNPRDGAGRQILDESVPRAVGVVRDEV